jgi:hypothetical protein
MSCDPHSPSWRQLRHQVLLGMTLTAFPMILFAQVIDPEAFIQKNGYQSQRLGDDGKTTFYNFTERLNTAQVAAREREVASLPKDERVFKYCDFVRGSTKAKLIESSGKNIDVAVSNYGYVGAVTACVLKYMHAGQVGTQVIYSKAARGSMFMLFVTH